jgi:hypothetical protein
MRPTWHPADNRADEQSPGSSAEFLLGFEDVPVRQARPLNNGILLAERYRVALPESENEA